MNTPYSAVGADSTTDAALVAAPAAAVNRANLSFLSSPGVMGRLIAARDWSDTPLGALENWPQSLRTSVSLMLNSSHPMWIGWGARATFLYNDAYIDVLSLAKHPSVLGLPAAEVWAEIWDFCGPLADKVFQRAEATFVDDVQLFMQRGDYLEEKWFSFSYSPITDESGSVAGLFCPSTDATASNISSRRLATLSALSASALLKDSVDGACAGVAATLALNPADMPFALLYLVDEAGTERCAGLRQAVHLAPGGPLAPASLALDGEDDDNDDDGADGCPWPLAPVWRDGRSRIADAAGLAGLPVGLAGQPVTAALTLALTMAGHDRPIGLLTLGVSPARKLDRDYRAFFDMVAGHVASAIQNALAAQEQRLHNERLAQLDRAKTAFFSNVSHEFRTPLTLMLAPLEELLAEPDHGNMPADSALRRERLLLVQRNARRLQKLVNTLLDFSRVQAGRMEARFAPVCLAGLTRDLASAFRSVMESAGLALTVECDDDIGMAWVDQGMWEKIVLNLLSNAFKFCFDGGVTVTLRQDGDQAVLAVSDTGVGIAQDQQSRVFERFQRVEGGRSRSHEGSGIGLALVRDLVELHHGAIGVTSVVDRGSTFTVRVPLGRAHPDDGRVDAPCAAPGPSDSSQVQAFTGEGMQWLQGEQASDTDPRPASAAADAPFPAQPTDGAHIVVADDNADMRGYLGRLLGGRWRLSFAVDGADALRLARLHAPELIVSDIMMPVLDGLGLVAALRADAQLADTPVLLLSARAGEEARIDGLNAGADDYLVKPFSARELLTRIDALLLRGRMRRVEREQSERIALIIRQVPAGIAILRGPAHVFELVNDRYRALVGRRDVRGLPIRAALPELADQGVLELLDQVYASGVPYVGRAVRAVLDPGPAGRPEECFFDFVYQPVCDADGRVEGVAVVAFDVSELVRARRDAELANRSKDEFMAMLGHELRNPLAPILIALELMRLKQVKGADRELAIVERQAQHMVRLVDDLLDVARIAQGKVQLVRGRVELSLLVAQAVETVSPLLEQRGHRVTLDVPARGMPLDADATRFAQVLANLLANAAKYTDAGGNIALEARVERGEPGANGGALAVITVRDNGIGIAPGMLEHLFDKFVQEKQALDRSQGGLGLGLAIVRNIVGLHGGSVSAHSDGVGRGSAFTIRVPLAREAGPAPDPAQPLTAGGFPGAAAGRKLVLLVDDNQDVLDTFSALLALRGYRVVAAADPASALKLAPELAPALAILDIGLPGMSGYELALELRRHDGFRRTRMVALSGYGQDADRRQSHEAGFAAHFVKPAGAREIELMLAPLEQQQER